MLNLQYESFKKAFSRIITGGLIVLVPSILTWMHWDFLPWWGHVVMWFFYGLYCIGGWIFFEFDNF